MPMASFAPKAKTHKGVVNIPNPPPKPALESPINSTAVAARSIEVVSYTQLLYGNCVVHVERRKGIESQRAYECKENPTISLQTTSSKLEKSSQPQRTSGTFVEQFGFNREYRSLALAIVFWNLALVCHRRSGSASENGTLLSSPSNSSQLSLTLQYFVC